MRSCMWEVTPTTHCSPKPPALRPALLVRHRSVYASAEWKRWCGSRLWYFSSAGCIRQLVIQGDEVIFKDLDRSSTGVTNCPTCKDHPCQVSHFRLVDILATFVTQAVSQCPFLPCCLLEWRSLWGLRGQPVQVQLSQRIHRQQLPASLIPALSLRYQLYSPHRLAVTVCWGWNNVVNLAGSQCQN